MNHCEVCGQPSEGHRLCARCHAVYGEWEADDHDDHHTEENHD